MRDAVWRSEGWGGRLCAVRDEEGSWVKDEGRGWLRDKEAGCVEWRMRGQAVWTERWGGKLSERWGKRLTEGWGGRLCGVKDTVWSERWGGMLSVKTWRCCECVKKGKIRMNAEYLRVPEVCVCVNVCVIYIWRKTQKRKTVNTRRSWVWSNIRTYKREAARSHQAYTW